MMTVFARRCGLLAVVLAAACSSTTGAAPPDAGTGSTPPDAGPPVVVDGGLPVPELPGTIAVVPNRSSVVLQLPVVEGALDYRVYEATTGVTVVTTDRQEHVSGAVIHCAGVRQRNQCNQTEVLPIVFNNSLLDSPSCATFRYDRTPDVPTPVMQTVEVNGIKSGATLVVEALDRQCPFPGMIGPVHRDIKIYGTEMPGPTEDVTVNGTAYKLRRWQPTFPVVTEAEVVARYGSLILNGEGPNKPVLDPANPAFPESPYVRIAQPAPVDDPIVLARSTVQVGTLPTALPEGLVAGDYFDDFEDATDQPKLLRTRGNVPAWLENASYFITLFQSKKWNFFDSLNEFSDFFVQRGQLVMLSGDPGQDAMSTQSMYPRRAVNLPSAAGKYLHVTYEVSHTETARRYEQVTLCGSDTAGATYAEEIPATAPVPRPGFMNAADTARTNPLGWNCLYLTPRGVGYGVTPGGDPNTHSDTTLRVTVVKTHPAPQSVDDYYRTQVTAYSAEYGPTQDTPFPRTWERRIDDAHQPVGFWLDDVQAVWQRTRFDVYIRRDRVIVYVNGAPRMCTSLAATPLTMAEGALGFWHVLYHTSAEFTEIRAGDTSSNPSTGQHQILHNTPFGDQRNWDNVGFHEDATLPAGFDSGTCF